ncbi:uncharacterized protein A1O9_08026 [Exophiala aquamarina CBS 119918]|uniref:ABM domain-containing protein n=1 Tax=Exophiala aquamarina CBS 119918 TaxID=1182545 RepID=A0A072PLN7_9EURO|nr:uncharacterized protein A1O9_08026 [Exophiala aquamarina CBS 119918]KEF56445.1 hypothetical protein A1O9_08026 [Exophiala aquamarina CBS 119918]
MTEQYAQRLPNPYSNWSAEDPAHPTFVVHGTDDTPGRKAYFIYLEAAPDHEEDVRSFMRDINTGVDKEPGTGPWFGTRYSKTSFAIFEAFPDAKRRHDHDEGPGGTNFARIEELRKWLAQPAQIYRLDVMFGKFGTMFGEEMEAIAK